MDPKVLKLKQKKLVKSFIEKPKKKESCFSKTCWGPISKINCVLKKSNLRSPQSCLVKKSVQKFYCSVSISAWGPGIRDWHIWGSNEKEIIDADGKARSLQKRYLCYTINEEYKLFCIDYHYKKLGKTSFIHVSQIRLFWDQKHLPTHASVFTMKIWDSWLLHLTFFQISKFSFQV